MIATQTAYLLRRRRLGEVDTQRKATAAAAVGIVLLGIGVALLASKPKMKPNRRKGGCRGRGGPYLLPDEKKFPAPTKACAKTALTYAAWPNNIDNAREVIENLKQTEYWDDPEIRDQAKDVQRIVRDHERGHRAGKKRK